MMLDEALNISMRKMSKIIHLGADEDVALLLLMLLLIPMLLLPLCCLLLLLLTLLLLLLLLAVLPSHLSSVAPRHEGLYQLELIRCWG
jgi:hypothetical protein